MRKKQKLWMHTFVNLALSFLMISVGFVCLLPIKSTSAATETDVYRSGYSTDGVSLMFNVYWGTEEVYRILDVLDEYNAKSTFFIGGCWADDNVECLKTIVSKGHEIGNHGYFHKDHSKLSQVQNVQEISMPKPNMFWIIFI